MPYGFGFAPESLDAGEQAQAARYDGMVTGLHERWEAAGLPSRRLEHLTGRAAGFRTERLPLDQAGESHTMDGRIACRRLLGGLTDAKLGGLSFWTQPNSWHHFMSDHRVTFCVLPLGPDRTLLRTTWLVHKDAVEGVDYDPAKPHRHVERHQSPGCRAGRNRAVRHPQPAYAPGPYSPHVEGLVEQFCQWYVERMTDAAGLLVAGIPASVVEHRTAAAADAPPAPPDVAAEVASFTVRFARSGRQIACASDTTVLAAARAAGIRLPFACGKGVCGTCKSRLLSGTIAMRHAGGIRPQEIDEGLALLCCGRPTSDLVIDR